MSVEPTESADGEVLEEFGGELRRFRLTIPFLAKVEKDCDAGPAVIAGALARAVQLLELKRDEGYTALATIAAGMGDWRIAYVRQTIFWGLQGAGMAPNDAGRLCRDFIDERGFMGLLENTPLAFRVITGASVGPKDDPVGESGGVAKVAPKKTGRSRSRTAARATR